MTIDPAGGSAKAGVQLQLSDRLALAAAYDLLFQQARACRNEGLRDLMTAMPPGRAAIAGVTALAGIVAFLSRDNPPTIISDQFVELVRAAVQAASSYPDIP